MLIREAAEVLDTTPAALYKAIERDQLPVTKIGQTVLIHENDLDLYRQRRRKPGRPRKGSPEPPRPAPPGGG